MGWKSMSVTGAAAALALFCAQDLAACELQQKAKPVREASRWREALNDVQKRFEQLTRPWQARSQPSRRIILQ